MASRSDHKFGIQASDGMKRTLVARRPANQPARTRQLPAKIWPLQSISSSSLCGLVPYLRRARLVPAKLSISRFVSCIPRGRRARSPCARCRCLWRAAAGISKGVGPADAGHLGARADCVCVSRLPALRLHLQLHLWAHLRGHLWHPASNRIWGWPADERPRGYDLAALVPADGQRAAHCAFPQGLVPHRMEG